MIRRAGLPSAQEVVGPIGGWVNQSYLLHLVDGQRWICRINSKEPESDKIRREAEIYQWLWERDRSLPISQVYRADLSRDILPYDYALLPALSGERVGSRIEMLPRRERDQLLENIGALLRRFHSLPHVLFGSLTETGDGTRDWRVYIRHRFETLLDRYIDALGYAPTWEKEIRRHWEKSAESVPAEVEPVFLHGDFHYDNLLFESCPNRGCRPTGVFDLEWAWAGDAVYDFLHLEEAFWVYPEDQPAFLGGYGLTSMPGDRLVVYRMLHALRLLTVGTTFRPEPLWGLVARQGAVIRNLLANKEPFSGL